MKRERINPVTMLNVKLTLVDFFAMTKPIQMATFPRKWKRLVINNAIQMAMKNVMYALIISYVFYFIIANSVPT